MRRVSTLADLAKYAKAKKDAPDEPEKKDSPQEEKAEAAAPVVKEAPKDPRAGQLGEMLMSGIADVILKAVSSVAATPPAPPVMKLPPPDPRVDALVQHQAETAVAVSKLQQAEKVEDKSKPKAWDLEVQKNRFGMMESVVITPAGGRPYKVNIQRNQAGLISRLSVKQ